MASKVVALEMNSSGRGGESTHFYHPAWTTVFENLAKLVSSGEHGGSIELAKLRSYLKNQSSSKLEADTGLPRHQLLHLASQLENYADKNNDGKISLHEWEDWIDLKMAESERFSKSKFLDAAVHVMAYSPTYTCSPPTIFILGISLLQIIFYLLCLYSPGSMGVLNEYGEPTWLTCSYFAYSPHRRREVWRFLTYMFLHVRHGHIANNLLVQLFVGIPLEMSQPGWVGLLRVAGVYMAGVVLGGLGASVAQPNKYLIGASAGVYALIMAHLATLILNWTEDGKIYARRRDENESLIPMKYNPCIRWLRLLFVVQFICVDIGMGLYSAYVLQEESAVSHAGHIFGGLAGLLVGVFLLQNRRVEDWEVKFQWISFSLYGICLCVFIAWNIAGTYTGWFLDEYTRSDELQCQ